MEEDKTPIKREFVEGSKKLYFIFGGIAARVTMPPFEFYKASRILTEDKIFIRDYCQSWYHAGLPRIGNDIMAISRYMKSQIAERKPEQVFCVGNSMGGYAAILFASLLEMNTEVIAFAPQTFISPVARIRYLDTRWNKQIMRTYLNSLFKRKIWDLRKHLLRSKLLSNISVFVSAQDRLDMIHAEHLQGITGVSIFTFDMGGHNIVRILRDQQKLPLILSGNYSLEHHVGSHKVRS